VIFDFCFVIFLEKTFAARRKLVKTAALHGASSFLIRQQKAESFADDLCAVLKPMQKREIQQRS